MSSYPKRILTPFGKITVTKNLALPAINHLVMSLPNPSDEKLKCIQNICFKSFLLNNGLEDEKKLYNAILQLDVKKKL